MIQPVGVFWNFAERERELFDSAKKIPTWRAANQGRRLLASTVHQLGERLGSPGAELIADADPGFVRRQALCSLGGIGARAACSIIALISSGYEREAMAHQRTLLEALLRAQQVNADPSGDVGRKLLAGRKPGTLKAAAKRFDEEKRLRVLNRFAHADLLSLMMLDEEWRTDRTTQERVIDLRPRRGTMWPAHQLLECCDDTVGLAVCACEGFGVGLQIPAWLSAEMKRYRDAPLPAGL